MTWSSSAGPGATAAIDKLVGILGLRIPAGLDERYQLAERIPGDERPVVFVGPFEHHSNELPWRESIAEVVVIREDADGHIDLADLGRQLARYAHRPLQIGSFSAASNVTGILTDTAAIAALLHAHGALSFWDFAAAGPYLPIRVAASRPGAGDHKDAVFLSPHKFIGGPQTPGVLVVRRELVRNAVPTAPGGGTVAYVDPIGHHYLDDPVAREEGGTPAIVGVDPGRAGLPAQAGGGHRPDRGPGGAAVAAALAAGPASPGIEVLGNQHAARLSIVSFGIRHGAPVPAPQLRRRAAERPVRHPGPRRLLVRRARTGTGCWASTRPARTRCARRSGTAARGSSRAGPGSTSTTSSLRPRPATSLPRSR